MKPKTEYKSSLFLFLTLLLNLLFLLPKSELQGSIHHTKLEYAKSFFFYLDTQSWRK